MPAPVEPVIADEGLDRFFQIRPHQPDLHLRLLLAQRIGKSEQDPGT